MHKVITVKVLANYKVRISFSDGIEGVIDLSDLVGKGVFAIWQDPKQFAKVFIDEETHTLAWPGGIDLCPDTLYEEVSKMEVS